MCFNPGSLLASSFFDTIKATGVIGRQVQPVIC